MTDRKTILLVFGTRSEAIKMAPLVKKLQSLPEQFKTVVAVTGQHRQMLDQVLHIFDIVPDSLAVESQSFWRNRPQKINIFQNLAYTFVYVIFFSYLCGRKGFVEIYLN